MIVLPFPPSVNTYWRTFRGRMLISKVGRQYRVDAIAAVLGAGHAPQMVGPLHVSIVAWLPDNRRRDADNLFKAPLDAMAHAGVYADDSQIRRLSIELAGVDRERPRLEVTLTAA